MKSINKKNYSDSELKLAELTIDEVLTHTQNASSTEAIVDGRRVVIEACEELVLRCGKASIVLCKDGKLLLSGTYVRSQAQGVNRIQGGSVQIN